MKKDKLYFTRDPKYTKKREGQTMININKHRKRFFMCFGA